MCAYDSYFRGLHWYGNVNKNLLCEVLVDETVVLVLVLPGRSLWSSQ